MKKILIVFSLLVVALSLTAQPEMFVNTLPPTDNDTKPTGLNVTGTTTKVITVPLSDGTSVSGSFNDLSGSGGDGFVSSGTYNSGTVNLVLTDAVDVAITGFPTDFSDDDLSDNSTDDLAEGLNLFYTETRVSNNPTVVANSQKIDSTTVSDIANMMDIFMNGNEISVSFDILEGAFHSTVNEAADQLIIYDLIGQELKRTSVANIIDKGIYQNHNSDFIVTENFNFNNNTTFNLNGKDWIIGGVDDLDITADSSDQIYTGFVEVDIIGDYTKRVQGNWTIENRLDSIFLIDAKSFGGSATVGSVWTATSVVNGKAHMELTNPTSDAIFETDGTTITAIAANLTDNLDIQADIIASSATATHVEMKMSAGVKGIVGSNDNFISFDKNSNSMNVELNGVVVATFSTPSAIQHGFEFIGMENSVTSSVVTTINKARRNWSISADASISPLADGDMFCVKNTSTNEATLTPNASNTIDNTLLLAGETAYYVVYGTVISKVSPGRDVFKSATVTGGNTNIDNTATQWTVQTAGATTAFLEDPTTVTQGYCTTITRLGGANLTITSLGGGVTINGLSSQIFNSNYQSATFCVEASGTEWLMQ